MRPIEAVQKVRERAHEEAQEYRHGEDRPLAGYTAALATYGATAAALALASRRPGTTVPARVPWTDLALSGIATFKLSRRLSKDPVTSPLRAPFARFGRRSGPSELTDTPREGSVRHAIGELVTCPFCLDQWVATAFISGLVFAPKLTRLAAATLTTVAISDALQFAHVALEQATGEAG